jgi:deoxyhypusine synthase
MDNSYCSCGFFGGIILKNVLNKYQKKTRIYPQIPNLKNPTIDNLIKYYTDSGAYNGGRLSEACKIYEKMIEEDATICLTLSGALTPTGIGGFISELIKNGLIDFIISTGANLYHDIHFALDLPVYQGDFRVDDKELLKAKIVRIYDIFIPEETLIKTDSFIQKIIKKTTTNKPVSTAYLHNLIGKELLIKSKKSNYSILAIAAQNNIPIFTPSPGDSSIGMNLAKLKLNNKGITIDTDLDILESTAIINQSRRTGAIELGGGAPKNFYMQTQPMLSQIMNINKGGHNYFIQITADAPHWGGLSGATPSEAISWGKIKPNQLKNDVVVYCDVTIAAPILFSYILSKNIKRGKKNLYSKREDYLKKFEEYHNKT